MKFINLTKNQKVIVDDNDFEWLNQWKWYYKTHHSSQGYASRIETVGGNRNLISMHRLIMDAGETDQVDHINLNKLDNRRSNLRICTNSQNQANKISRACSGFKGVYRRGQKWASYIRLGKKQKYIGIYSSPEDAAKAFNHASKQLYGEFSRTNTI